MSYNFYLNIYTSKSESEDILNNKDFLLFLFVVAVSIFEVFIDLHPVFQYLLRKCKIIFQLALVEYVYLFL